MGYQIMCMYFFSRHRLVYLLHKQACAFCDFKVVKKGSNFTASLFNLELIPFCTKIVVKILTTGFLFIWPNKPHCQFLNKYLILTSKYLIQYIYELVRTYLVDKLSFQVIVEYEQYFTDVLHILSQSVVIYKRKLLHITCVKKAINQKKEWHYYLMK